ncbi:uncharacterized protein LOC111888852 isoform X1 [Lactuca sativa]|uniref:uncharacterized protein LOC111888852 isoform X1 n=1 Tax=Lactuca sativa TaxID=4236 RepID=UPI000CD8DCBF|nr:uncharacterized protein LOC111888852 isoform X1 [Lactuca sativa]XP_023740744.1 uncharacterized protein LOC111888852 isoform X1 [Lactuca sativa]
MNEKGITGSCMIIGLLMWRIQREEQVKTDKFELLNKLKNAETEIKELKRRRVEDAKANEKVVSMFAAHEQRWLMERKKLTQQIRALLHELRVINTKTKENVSGLCGQLEEKEKLLEEEKDKRREQEESVKKAEKINEELRETLKREAQEHSKEIWKHKSAFIELVSTQRQLEAEMGRAVRQMEAEKQEVNGVLEQKEQYVLMTQKLSMELIKTRKDLEQKDKILSAMLRKSKLDTAEKKMLLKEVKMSKSKTVPESRHERYSLRSMLSRHHKSKPEQLELKDDQCSASPFSQQSIITEGSQEFDVAANIGQLEGWVQCETEKYISVVEQRHEVEVNAFAEQLRLKDEKLEAFRWHSMSMDIEMKRLHSHIEGLDHDLTNLKQQNHKLESLLFNRESELHALKSELQLNTPKPQKEKDEQVPSKAMVLAVQSPDKEFEDKKDLVSVGEECSRKKDIVSGENISSSSSSWKMDLHALGVLYKIKRLKQQLVMFERLTGKQESCENREYDDKRKLYSLVSVVSKQVSRYQSLQEKANDICKRMYENDGDAGSGVKMKKLEHFLEETFQLQRYIVATGQKLIEIQSKIASGFVGGVNDGFDMKKFGDCVRSLFREVQRGLEVRISRIIGDLEAPLAWDGIIHHPTT